MSKNPILIVLGVLSLLLVSMAVAKPFSAAPAANAEQASDFYQRHPEWTWTVPDGKALLPVTGGDSAYPDYAQRHPELSSAVAAYIDTTDYFFRHPELRIAGGAIDLTDYYFRHAGQ
jgi:hypothetical protein